MKKLTMVMRCGNEKGPDTAMMYTLIGEDYSFERMMGSDIAAAIAKKQIEVTNLGLGPKGLAATNGSMKNYTTFDAYGNLVNEPRAVILNRVENEKGLLGYTIYGTNGTIQEVTVKQAAELAKANKIANGKIRSTQKGDIVASISGNYPLRTIKMAEAKQDDTITVDVMFFGSTLKGRTSVKYAGLMISSKSAVTLTKMHTQLSKDNGEVVNKIKETTGVDETESIGIKVNGSAGFYGAYNVDTAFDIIAKAGNKIKLPLGKLMIACTDYDADKAESTIMVTPDMKPGGYQTGTDRTDAALKTYTKSIITKLTKVSIEK